MEQMAHDAITFVEAMGFERVDLLGFSLGSFVAQEIALIRPDLSRRVVLASAAPQGAAGMHGWAPDVVRAVGGRDLDPVGYLDVFFTPTSREAGEQALTRMLSRTAEPDEPTSWQTRQAQYDAACAWGIPNHSLLQRLAGIDQPTLVANGDSDPMILPHYSYLLAGLLPRAKVTISAMVLSRMWVSPGSPALGLAAEPVRNFSPIAMIVSLLRKRKDPISLGCLSRRSLASVPLRWMISAKRRRMPRI